jgi:hypothetical protein
LLILLRFACRLAMAAACLALATLWVEPDWHSKTRTLELRVRKGPEVLQAARALADRAWSAARERDLPAVASGAEREAAQDDQLTEEDRRLLQRLIEEKLRE